MLHKRWFHRLQALAMGVWAPIDWPLFAGLLALSGMGLFVLQSAAIYPGQTEAQAVRLGLGFLCMLCVARIPPRFFLRVAPIFYYVGIFLLILVLILGNVGKGARRWLIVGPVRFQPSELMKLVVPMMVAQLLARNPLPPSFRVSLYASVLVLLPTALVAKQPDLGTALVVLFSGFVVIFLAGLPFRVLGVVALSLCLSLPVAWHFLHDYQRHRIETFIHPERDPLGKGYHIIQSKIAIGSGGLHGKGWKGGTQSHLEFLPERATDFIFAVLGEELGLLGALLMITLYMLIILRGMYISIQAKDSFSRLLAGSVIWTFAAYAIVNMGMVSGVLPVVGLPLPLVSFGGTAVVTLLGSFGLLMSVQAHRHFWSEETS